jgi:glycosyltransferase involved in cell wall biosynthesis
VKQAPLITVLTPTYNRAALLARLHRSLCGQTFSDFEWLIVDDGSTDGTGSAVPQLTGKTPNFGVRYLRKENGGKHTAMNLGVREARGTFCAVLDSDDWYAPQCLERLKFHWDSIRDPRRFAEVQGLCATADGSVIGSPFPQPVFDSDYYELAETLRVSGDRVGMIRTDVLRAHPFPEQFGNVYVPEGIVWNRIARKYRMRGVNEVLGFKEYLEGGLTSTSGPRHVAQAGPRLLYVEELLGMRRPLPPGPRFRAYANLTRYGLNYGRGVIREARRAPSLGLWALALPAGLALAARDRLVARADEASLPTAT